MIDAKRLTWQMCEMCDLAEKWNVLTIEEYWAYRTQVLYLRNCLFLYSFR